MGEKTGEDWEEEEKTQVDGRRKISYSEKIKE